MLKRFLTCGHGHSLADLLCDLLKEVRRLNEWQDRHWIELQQANGRLCRLEAFLAEQLPAYPKTTPPTEQLLRLGVLPTPQGPDLTALAAGPGVTPGGGR